MNDEFKLLADILLRENQNKDFHFKNVHVVLKDEDSINSLTTVFEESRISYQDGGYIFHPKFTLLPYFQSLINPEPLDKFLSIINFPTEILDKKTLTNLVKDNNLKHKDVSFLAQQKDLDGISFDKYKILKQRFLRIKGLKLNKKQNIYEVLYALYNDIKDNDIFTNETKHEFHAAMQIAREYSDLNQSGYYNDFLIYMENLVNNKHNELRRSLVNIHLVDELNDETFHTLMLPNILYENPDESIKKTLLLLNRTTNEAYLSDKLLTQIDLSLKDTKLLYEPLIKPISRSHRINQLINRLELTNKYKDLFVRVTDKYLQYKWVAPRFIDEITTLIFATLDVLDALLAKKNFDLKTGNIRYFIHNTFKRTLDCIYKKDSKEIHDYFKTYKQNKTKATAHRISFVEEFYQLGVLSKQFSYNHYERLNTLKVYIDKVMHQSEKNQTWTDRKQIKNFNLMDHYEKIEHVISLIYFYDSLTLSNTLIKNLEEMMYHIY